MNMKLMYSLKNITRKFIIRGGKDKNGKDEKNRSNIFNLLILFIVLILVSLMLPRGKSLQFGSLKEGEIYVGDRIIAPFTFAINKTDEQYQQDIEEAKASILEVFVKDDSVCVNKTSQITTFFDRLNSVINSRDEAESPALTTQLANFFESYRITQDESILRFFERREFQSDSIEKTETLIAFQETLIRLMRDVCGIGVLGSEIGSKEKKVSLLVGNEEIEESLDYFYTIDKTRSVVIDRLRAGFKGDEQRVNVAYRIFVHFLSPNVYYDKDETKARHDEAISNVPRAKGTILENEKILDTYEKVTKEHIAKLNSLAIEKAEREAGRSQFLTVIRNAGKILMVGLGLSIFLIFLIFNRWRLLRNKRKVVLVALIFLLVASLSFFTNKFVQSPYLLPITIASMLLTIFFDTRVGFVGTISLAIILGAMRGNEYIVTMVSIIAGTGAVMSVAKVRSRSWFLKSILIISAAYLLSITIIESLRYTSFSKMLEYWFHGAINGFLSPLLAYGLQVLMEYVFDLTTDLRLLELSDLNRPLLRRLAVEAPGTYHHSIMVANLAEGAAEAIGADALLARVGAYYHDIGKIEKPEYFIENTLRMKNPHEKLSPNMSSLILTNHVRRGLELAEEYNLPERIKRFIPEHHGTNVMTFFYKKAMEQNKNGEIDISTFRYPGPKPTIKETGIVMLADGVEAASRTLKDPSASRIRGMVTSIVHERFREFELDQCPLTMRDLNKIIESFSTVLLGTFHARIEYPNQEEKFFPKASAKEKVADEKD